MLMFVVALRRCVLVCARVLSSKIIEGLQHLDAATAAPSAGRRASTEQACPRARRAAAQRESEGRATPPRDAHPGEHSSSTTWPLGAEPRRPSCQSRNSGRASRAAERGRAATGFARLASARSFTYTYGLWPMMRPEAVTGATRALWCRDWHEVRVDARTDR